LIFFLFVVLFNSYRAFFVEEIASRPLNDFDEARYAEVAKNIVKTKNWVVPLAGGPDEPRNIISTRLPNG